MRRKEREITDFEEMIKILDESNFLTLAMINGNEPYSVPVNFGYKLDGDRKQIQIFIHGATEGTKLNCIKNCPRVSFSAVCYCEIGTDKEPCGWTNFYRSVCGKGNAVVLEDADEKKEGLICILKKYGYKGPTVFPAIMMKKTSMIRIDVEELTGKFHEK
ncbi:MAG: pyridoxamine 5'-phosphate oxidase family protein [Spirochaetales bacterium]|nr:pyridoxamine 5'-phosphate oxidase family protein [Spirochaetales bacterium]